MTDRADLVALTAFTAGSNEIAKFLRARVWIEKGAMARANNRGEPPPDARWLGKVATPHESWIGFVKRSAYRLLKHHIKEGDVTLFERVIRGEGRQVGSKTKLLDNPFYFGMVALFYNNEIIRLQDRSLFAMQMLYAYKHRVPSRSFIGFLYQSGNQALMRKKLAHGYIETGYAKSYNGDIWADAQNPPERFDLLSMDLGDISID